MPDDNRDMPSRPSPDALLENARREARGRLKIFLGAAPGVGKTYAMLTGARAVKAEGRDVAVAPFLLMPSPLMPPRGFAPLFWRDERKAVEHMTEFSGRELVETCNCRLQRRGRSNRSPAA